MRKLTKNDNHSFGQFGHGYYANVSCSKCGVVIKNKNSPCISLKEEIKFNVAGVESAVLVELGRVATLDFVNCKI